MANRNNNNKITTVQQWRMNVSTKLGWITGVITLQSALILGLIWSMSKLMGLVASLQ